MKKIARSGFPRGKTTKRPVASPDFLLALHWPRHRLFFPWFGRNANLIAIALESLSETTSWISQVAGAFEASISRPFFVDKYLQHEFESRYGKLVNQEKCSGLSGTQSDAADGLIRHSYACARLARPRVH
jgi:hypothetical protein